MPSFNEFIAEKRRKKREQNQKKQFHFKNKYNLVKTIYNPKLHKSKIVPAYLDGQETKIHQLLKETPKR